MSNTTRYFFGLMIVICVLPGWAPLTGLAQQTEVWPASDPANTGNWQLNSDVSDEFEGTQLDTDKWFVQGSDNGYHKWKGRAPSQFAPHNVRLEDGKLKLKSQWQPDYPFAKEEFGGAKYENITTAGVISHQKFLNGYMEIKSKAADAAMTSSFWTLGYQSELDTFEQMGAPKLAGHIHDNYFMFSIHDWRPGAVAGKNKVFTNHSELDFRVADDFHVYGCDWDENYLKFYVDGKEVHSTTKAELGDAWVLTNPLEVWFDSEVFSWLGIPVADELPVDFEVEYVRIWQKPNSNLLDRAFYGFEGPFLKEVVRKPEKEDKHQESWWIDQASSKNFSIVGNKFSSGRKSLKFVSDGKLAKDEVVAFAPYGAVEIPAGDYTLSMKVWLEPGSKVKQISPVLEDPWLQIQPIDLTGVARGEWVTVSNKFSRAEASKAKDRLRLVVYQKDVAAGNSTMYIDDVAIVAEASGK